MKQTTLPSGQLPHAQASRWQQALRTALRRTSCPIPPRLVTRARTVPSRLEPSQRASSGLSVGLRPSVAHRLRHTSYRRSSYGRQVDHWGSASTPHLSADLARVPPWLLSPKVTPAGEFPALSATRRAGSCECWRSGAAGCTLIGVNSPIRGDLTRMRVQVSDTLKPHGSRFPGMPDCHRGAGFRQRRATGGLSLLSFQCRAFAVISLPS
jgi:hypothetical protein